MRRSRRHPRLASGALGAAALLAASCASRKMDLDPTVLVQSPHGTELGVSTDYGVVFLGSRTTAGEVEVTAWFGDGAAVESSVVEPIGAGLYTAEIDIVLPWAELTFETPRPGAEVEVAGRRNGERWEEELRVVSHPAVTSGLLLRPRGEFPNDPSQVGAGVFVEGEDGHPRLLGLVSGFLELTVDGETELFLTVVGPRDLWRLVVHRREEPFEKRWIYRDDIL